jgi:hypothetical protein
MRILKCSAYRVVLCTIAVAIGLCGCGHRSPTGDIEKTVPAAGVLTFQGEPLEYYQVMLFPEGARPAGGVSDEQGKFILGTNDQGDGAVPGRHQVSIVYVGPPRGPEWGMDDFSPPPPPKVKIPEKYARAETSGVTVEIPDSGAGDLQIDLQ